MVHGEVRELSIHPTWFIDNSYFKVFVFNEICFITFHVWLIYIYIYV